jgi:hypothetical protein
MIEVSRNSDLLDSNVLDRRLGQASHSGHPLRHGAQSSITTLRNRLEDVIDKLKTQEL